MTSRLALRFLGQVLLNLLIFIGCNMFLYHHIWDRWTILGVVTTSFMFLNVVHNLYDVADLWDTSIKLHQIYPVLYKHLQNQSRQIKIHSEFGSQVTYRYAQVKTAYETDNMLNPLAFTGIDSLIKQYKKDVKELEE